VNHYCPHCTARLVSDRIELSDDHMEMYFHCCGMCLVKTHQEWLDIPALRKMYSDLPGEQVCHCGALYQPRSKMQKQCPVCEAERQKKSFGGLHLGARRKELEPKKQNKIYELTAKGYKIREVARMMNLARSTVRKYAYQEAG
jgi:hypothetical protein